MAKNITQLSYLGSVLRNAAWISTKHSPQQMFMLMRLYLGGCANLKEIARREFTTPANLSAMFKKLEKDGLINREICKDDRRNYYYSVTESGAKIAKQMRRKILDGIKIIIKDITKSDREKLLDASRFTYKMLTLFEEKNLRERL